MANWSNLESFDAEFLVVPRVVPISSSSSSSISLSSSSSLSFSSSSTSLISLSSSSISFSSESLSSTSFSWSSSSESTTGSPSSSSSSHVGPFQAAALVDGSEAYKFFCKDSDGLVWGCGSNSYGDLADGTDIFQWRMVPTDVTSPKWFMGGRDTAFYVDQSDVLWGRGRNSWYQMGLGVSTPAVVSSWTQIGTGYKKFFADCGSSTFFCFTTKVDGTLWGWGQNNYGQLGLGNTFRKSSPVSIPLTKSVVQASGGFGHSLLLTQDGEVYTSGYNGYGNLGRGSYTGQSYFEVIPTSATFVQVEAGHNHSLALDDEGYVHAWGYNVHGELADGFNLTSDEPKTILSAGEPYTKIAAGLYSSYALGADGVIWSWGWNNYNQLGDGTGTSRSSPVSIVSNRSFVDLYSNSYSVMALDSEGYLWAWGDHTRGQLGLGEGHPARASTPTLVGLVSPSSSSTSLEPVGERFRLGEASGLWSALLSPYGRILSSGRNYYGNLGDGTTVDKYKPVEVLGERTFTAYASGDYHTIAVDTSGKLWSWGAGAWGRLGDGSTVNRSSPVSVASDRSFVEVSGGNVHSLALEANGTLWGWGYNNFGQLGDGTKNSKAIPNSVRDSVASMSAGYYTTMIIDEDGYAWGTGYNQSGGLGTGDITSRSTFVAVVAPTLGQPAKEWKSIAAGFQFTIAIDTDDYCWSWGAGSQGRRGGGTTSSVSSPVSVSDGIKFKQVSAGYSFSLALALDGTVYSVGSNSYGSLGRVTVSSYETSWTPIDLSSKFVDVMASEYSAYGVDVDGGVWSWGRNDYGQLGYGSLANKTTPVMIARIYPIMWSSSSSSTSHSSSSTSPSSSSSSAYPTDFPRLPSGGVGEYYTGIIDAWGRAWAWGYNNYGKLADYSTTSKSSTQRIPISWFFNRQAAGGWHQELIRDDGTIWGAGYNGIGQLGNGVSSTTNLNLVPATVGSTRFAEITAGWYHTVAIDTEGAAWSWGYNGYWQLGHGTASNSYTPKQVVGGHSFTQVAGGYYFTMAIDHLGRAWGWGYNGYGQLGLNTTAQKSSPEMTVGSYVFDDIACGYNHTAAVKTDGSVMCWGRGAYGQNGDNFTSNRSSPVSIASAQKFDKVACGYNFTLGIANNGQVYSWGQNNYGQLGNNASGPNQSTPVSVIGITRPVVDISCSAYSAHALTDTGVLYSWGYNGQGGLGLGDTTPRSTPTVVPETFYLYSSSSSLSSSSYSSHSLSSSSFSVSSSSSTANDIVSGLMHRWPLDPSNGASDTHGSNDLTNNNSVPFTENGAEFNGTDQWLNATVSLPSTFSIFLRVKPFSHAEMTPVLSTAPGDWTQDRVGLMADGDYDLIAWCNGSNLEFLNIWSESKFSLGKFTSVCITCDGSTLKVYRAHWGEGIEYLGSTSVSAGRGQSFSLGRNGPDASGYFDGFIKDVSVYDRALNSTEVRVLHEKDDSAIKVDASEDYQFVIRTDPWDGPIEDTFVWSTIGGINEWINESRHYYSINNWSTYSTDTSYSMSMGIYTVESGQVAYSHSNDTNVRRMGRYTGDHNQLAQRFSTGVGDAGLTMDYVIIRTRTLTGGSEGWKTSDKMRLEWRKYAAPGSGKLISHSGLVAPPTGTNIATWMYFYF